MNKITGFFTIDSSINNVVGSVNPVGELSPLSRTYSKDITYHSENNGGLHVFDAFNDTGATEATILADSANIATRINAVVTRFMTGVTGTMINELTAALVAGEYNLAAGPAIINPNDGNNPYPEWISFTVDINGIIWDVKVWFSDQSFSTTYEYGQIELVMPLTDMWLFQTDFAAASVGIAGLTPTSLINKAGVEITTVVTRYETVTITGVDVTAPLNTVAVPIMVAINGNALYATPEAIITAISNALVSQTANSTNVTDWYPVFPELEVSGFNIYRVIPRWGNIAVANIALNPPLYGPTLRPTDFSPLAAAYFNDIASILVDSHIVHTTALFKSMGLFILPDVLNPDGRIAFDTKFADYMVIPANDNTINQVSLTTRGVITILNDLLALSETYQAGAALPVGVNTELYNTHRYLTKLDGSTKIAVLTRQDFLGL